MASPTRTKGPQRGTKSKSGRRLPPKVKTGPAVPLLPLVVSGVLVALAVGLFIYYFINTRPNTPASVAGIPCDQLEQTQTHYHVALQIVHEGVLTPIPSGIGIQGGETTPTCFYWLHVHSANQDVIHIESPASDTFTLGQFFAVWTAWSKSQGGPSEPLNATHVSSFTLTTGEKLYVYVDTGDGKGAQLYTGDPNAIVLTKHEIITLEIQTGNPNPPPAFDWNSAANKGL